MTHKRPLLDRPERRAIRFVSEAYPELYHAIFGELMALSPEDRRAQALHAVAEICLEVGKAAIGGAWDEETTPMGVFREQTHV